MLDPTPWLIDGASHSAAVARTLAYAATGGANGIISPLDLQVRALATPGTSVRVAPGAAVIRSPYSGGGQQSYVLRNVTETQVPIEASGSAGARTWYVVATLEDPEFAGQEPADPLNHEYSALEAWTSINVTNKPFVPLAKIVVPANTATITQSMITDLRELANPRFQDIWIPRPTVNRDISGYSHDLRARRKGSDHLRGEQWPDSKNGGRFDVDCPSWATRMLVTAEWNGVRLSGKSAWGSVYLSFVASGATERWTQDFAFDVLENNTIYRTNFKLSDTLSVPKEMRGKPMSFYMKAFLDNAAPVGAVKLDAGSGINFQIRFLEEADSQVQN